MKLPVPPADAAAPRKPLVRHPQQSKRRRGDTGGDPGRQADGLQGCTTRSPLGASSDLLPNPARKIDVCGVADSRSR